MKNKYSKIPSPLTIAFLLLGFVFACATLFFNSESLSFIDQIAAVFEMTYNGMWGVNGMAFLVQMALMLILGHILALSAPVKRIIAGLLKRLKNSNQAIMLTAALAMLGGFVNWGFGLILGAIFAKSVIDYFHETDLPINKALVAACGYTGMLIWHGGISGSSLIKVAEPGHLNSLAPKFFSLQATLPVNETIFSGSNLLTYACMFFGILFLAKFLNRKQNTAISAIPSLKEETVLAGEKNLDSSTIFAFFIGGCALIGSGYLIANATGGLSFLTPNFINFSLLGLGILMHKNLKNFSGALDNAIAGSSGILIQFPIYFAIMGIMSGSGMVQAMAQFFVSISSENSLPFFTFLSAGIINVFVPSGGGQWMIQGPIIIESCKALGIPLAKGIMALAYGDQLTNMLQPFWALPLLGITQVKAGKLLPYTFKFFLLGLLVFSLSIFLF